MLKGKVAIVTGSTSGIGLGIARALAQAGCNVMLNGLGDPVEIEQIRNRLVERSVANCPAVEFQLVDAIMCQVDEGRIVG